MNNTENIKQVIPLPSSTTDQIKTVAVQNEVTGMNSEKSSTSGNNNSIKQETSETNESSISTHNQPDYQSPSNEALQFTTPDSGRRPEDSKYREDIKENDNKQSTEQQPSNIIKSQSMSLSQDDKSHNDTRSSSVKEEWSVPDSYIVDPDAGVITCVCGYDEDDGFTIQCDHCFRWQHAICYNINNMDAVPDDYLCNVCNPRDIDIKLARQIQKRRFSSFMPNSEPVYETDTKNGNKKRKKSNNSDSNDVNHKGNSVPQQGDVRDSKSESLPAYDLIRKKEHLITAKDAFPAAYISMNKCSFKNPLLADFFKKHSEDSFILPNTNFHLEKDAIEVRSYSEITYSRTFPGFNKLGIFAMRPLPEGSFLCEAIGELNFISDYLNDSRNQYHIWGMPKRKVLFHDQWPILIDQRLSSNKTRYLRKSCNPNVELVTVYANNNSNDVPIFAYRALRDIKEDEELHAKWQWNKNHPILKMIENGERFEGLTTDEKDIILESVDAILAACECACGNNNKDCYILKIKRIINSLCKTVRSKMNNRYKLNEVFSQFKSHQRKREPPVLHRLIKRTKIQLEANQLESKDSLKKDENNGTPAQKKIELTPDMIQTPKRLYSSGSLTSKRLRYSNISKLFNFNESDTSELENLMIPIELPIDMSDIDNTNLISNRHLHSNPLSILTGGNVKDHSKEHITSGTVNQNDTVSRSSTPLNFSDTLDHSSEITQDSSQYIQSLKSKKKLSFADYKKKLSK